jgi:TniQ
MTPLAFQRRPIPDPDELLSSYLVRLAASLGISPHRLGAQLGDRFEIWNRDIDRCASSSLISAVARYTNLNYEAVQDMTLQGFEASLSGSGRHHRQQGIATWINAIGIFHRIRKLHGLQYCPLCLEETLGYKRIWRLSFVTVCADHQLALRDGCPHCDAPVVPHRSWQAGLRCHACGRHLTATPLTKRCELTERAALQTLFIEAGSLTTRSPEPQLSSAADFFIGSSQVLQVVKSKLVQAGRGWENDGSRFELLRTDVRGKYAAVLLQLLNDWPRKFIEFSDKHSVSQTCFSKYPPMPAWIGDVVRELPARIRQRKNGAASSSVTSKDHKATSWRTERAKTLLRAAGRTS